MNDTDVDDDPAVDNGVTYPTRFNHVAMSVTADLLDADGRAALCAFYGDVFGWEELPTMTVDRERLVLSVHQFDQFVFLIAADEPMRTEPMDHFGMAVESIEALEGVVARARAWQERGEDVRIIDHQVEDHDVLKLHNAYIGYRLPLLVEVQHFELTA